MYPNLNAEMARRNITSQKIGEVLRKCEKTARNKLNGDTPFTISEARLISEQLFPGMSIDYLFEKNKETTAEFAEKEP